MIASLGKIVVTASGTPVRATSNLSDPTARIGAQSIRFTVVPANTGLIYIGLSNMNISTGVGVLDVLPVPASATSGPFASTDLAQVVIPAGLNPADIYIDTSHSGDGVYGAYTQG